jgi:protein-S-isoprenylcysteine O-methyltransferase Ste14
MDPLNIIVGINVIATFSANFSGAKKGVKSKLVAPKEKPKTYLQSLPLVLSTVSLIAIILGVFQLGTLSYGNNELNIRLAGLIVYLIFSWIQIWAYKSLGENYSQDIMILREHHLVIKGPFKIIRHPQYLSQILLDIGASFALMSYLVLPIALIEIPLLIMRANLEEKLLEKNFKESFVNYKRKSGFMIPFIG